MSDGVLTASDTFIVTVTGTAVETWRFANFGTTANTGNAADIFDANDDGELNLLEYATSQNPNTNTTAPYSAARSGSNLEFTYTKNKSATDVNFTVEWSDTLGNDWSTVGVTQSLVPGSDNGVTQQIKATMPAGVSGRRFLHLKVTRP